MFLRNLSLVGLLSALVACASTSRFEVVRSPEASECVVLLHGLNRSWRAMRPMARALQRRGFITANVDYPSRSGPIAELVAISVEPGLDVCRQEGASRIHFVTHSIGGILLRYAHAQEPIPDLGRVVMVAPPNQGSEVVDWTEHWPGAGLIGSEAGLQLGTGGTNSVPARLGPVDFEVGVIAGDRTINPLLSAMLPNPDDGKVSVASTKVTGMRDFLVVNKNHRTIVAADIVIDNTLAFLERGAFLGAEDETN